MLGVRADRNATSDNGLSLTFLGGGGEGPPHSWNNRLYNRMTRLPASMRLTPHELCPPVCASNPAWFKGR